MADTMSRYAYALANLCIPPPLCRDCGTEIHEGCKSVALMRPDGRPFSATYCDDCWRSRSLDERFDIRSTSELNT